MRRTYLSCFLLLVFLVQLPENAAGAKCYACSYLFAGHDGTFGYSCVNDTSNFETTSQIECELPRKCIIKAVYDRNVQRLLSMDKGCQVPQGETGCDAPDGIRPVCYYNCDTDLCNSIDGNLAFEYMPVSWNAAPTASSGLYVTLMMAVLSAYTSV
ncbi:uncharacterized protein [Haliotis cracherodii]|uniref:uncharacterized protein n=1 Tax=Haliotis cracherodii TaxID=6455 RepID=UPI0039E9F929